MDKTSKVYIAGHRGAIGSELLTMLKKEGYNHLLTANSSDLNLTDKKETEKFFKEQRPEYVFLLSATRGSIQDYAEYPVDIFTKDMQIYLNVMECSWKFGVKKLLFTSSVCVYPENEKEILYEEDFRSGWVPASMESYALAKAAGMSLCEYYNKQYGTNFITAVLGNIYGEKRQKSSENNTVIPSLIRNIKEAVNENKRTVTIWGNGEVKRAFLHVTDCVKALFMVMQSENNYWTYNISGEEEITINELAEILIELIGFNGRIEHDYTKPDGAKRAKIDIAKIKELGWKPEIDLKEGLKEMILRY